MKKRETKALVASLIGSSIEWFDFFLYGTMASLVFNQLFFPNFDPVVGLLLSYASFGIPFLSGRSAELSSAISAIKSAARKHWFSLFL